MIVPILETAFTVRIAPESLRFKRVTSQKPVCVSASFRVSTIAISKSKGFTVAPITIPIGSVSKDSWFVEIAPTEIAIVHDTTNATNMN